MNFKCGDKLIYTVPDKNGEKVECSFIETDGTIAKIICLNDLSVKQVDVQFLSVANGYKSIKSKAIIKGFMPKNGKTSFILSKAAELYKNNIPFLLIDNELGILLLAQKFKDVLQEQYGIDDTRKNESKCYLRSEPNISAVEIFDMCKTCQHNNGIKILLFDSINNNDDNTVYILETIAKVLDMIVIATKQIPYAKI